MPKEILPSHDEAERLWSVCKTEDERFPWFYNNDGLVSVTGMIGSEFESHQR